MPARTARISSNGTTTNTITAALRCLRLATFTTKESTTASSSGKPLSMLHTGHIQGDIPEVDQQRQCPQARYGSTSQSKRLARMTLWRCQPSDLQLRRP